MHHIYHTEGIILGSKGYGEAGKCYYIFTRDLGLIYASAQGVRKMSSKLRFILHDFAYIRVDLVQGKDFWRVTSASKTNELEQITRNPGSLAIFAKVANLLRRLLAGVESNPTLFHDLKVGLQVLEKSKSKDELASIEIIFVLRILHNLGYIGENEALIGVIKSPFEPELVFQATKERARMLSIINKALKETHL